jgi:hypothetical protein
LDRGGSIRDKATFIIDLLRNANMLEHERKTAREFREKFNAKAGITGS